MSLLLQARTPYIIFVCLSNLGGSGLRDVLFSLMNSRRTADFFSLLGLLLVVRLQ